MRLRVDDQAPQLRLVDVEGNPVVLGQARHRTLLCFFGDAACAFCNVYVYDLLKRYGKLSSLGLDVVVLYNANQEAVWQFVSGRPRPFPVIADHTAVAYRLYGIEHSAWGKLKGVIARLPTFVKGVRMVGTAGINANTTMPADFLIDKGGRIATAHYGADPGDHISFEHVEAFARWSTGGRSALPQHDAVAIG